jgi:mRNA interferase RelE/StbE
MSGPVNSCSAQTRISSWLATCEAALAVNPHRVGKPLFGPIAGCHRARRGTYRIVYWIEENTRTVHVLDIDHRAEIYLHGPCTGR